MNAYEVRSTWSDCWQDLVPFVSGSLYPLWAKPGCCRRPVR